MLHHHHRVGSSRELVPRLHRGVVHCPLSRDQGWHSATLGDELSWIIVDPQAGAYRPDQERLRRRQVLQSERDGSTCGSLAPRAVGRANLTSDTLFKGERGNEARRRTNNFVCLTELGWIEVMFGTSRTWKIRLELKGPRIGCPTTARCPRRGKSASGRCGKTRLERPRGGGAEKSPAAPRNSI